MPRQLMCVSTQISSDVKLSRLIIPSHIAEHFTIASTRPSSPCLRSREPATKFTEQKPCLVDLHVYVNFLSFISISVENTGDAPHNFTGAFVGHVLPPPL